MMLMDGRYLFRLRAALLAVPALLPALSAGQADERLMALSLDELIQVNSARPPSSPLPGASSPAS